MTCLYILKNIEGFNFFLKIELKHLEQLHYFKDYYMN